MIRINEVPKSIQVHFVQNDLDTKGLWKPPFPPDSRAVANALYKMKGKRYYNQPFKDEPEKVT
jgi:isoquinoline 1-oxidoreductase beta subunit